MKRFFVILNREKMDYTKWRENLCIGKSLIEINNEAINFTKGFESEYSNAEVL